MAATPSSGEPARRKIRVLWLIMGLGPGGAEMLLVSAAKVRDRERFDHEAAYLLSWKSHLASAIEDLGVPVTCLGVNDARDPRWPMRLRRFLSERDFDVIHVHSPLVAATTRLLVKTMPKAKRPAVISTEHNIASSWAPASRILNELTLPWSDAALAVSSAAAASLPARLQQRVEVVVHGVSLEHLDAERSRRDESRRDLGVDDGDVVVATVANLRAQKAYPDLLRAASIVCREAPEVVFAAVGQGPLEDEIRQMVDDMGLGGRFRLLGYRADAAFVVAGADIFVLSSLYEGFPISVMEAMALGKPVVATSVGGIPTAIDDGVEGLLVEPSQPEALAEAILALVRDAERRKKMGEAAAVRGRGFDITRAVRRTEEIYAEIAAARKG